MGCGVAELERTPETERARTSAGKGGDMLDHTPNGGFNGKHSKGLEETRSFKMGRIWKIMNRPLPST